MNTTKTIIADSTETVPFKNNMNFCVGTGRMGLALQKEYLDQLELVQESIGFSYIRGHGLFCDDMAVCRSYTDEDGKKQLEYNFTYIDMVMDSYLEKKIKPFLELGFMPGAMASDTDTVFYWKGNITPPRDYSDWIRLIQALLLHLIERYSREEVLTWPIEVWNEPNLSVFWKNADMQEYFKLYEYSAKAVKEIDQELKVGGPAICGVKDQEWIRAFLEFTRTHKVPLDFVTRHHYTIELPEQTGHYSYTKLHDIEESFNELETTRAIVDSFPEYRGMDIHITEFNTAYVPDAPLHDTNLNAAYCAALLSRLGDCHASYAYWTFGDIFEEKDVPFTPFHGGFGLVANGGIPKPTFWTFEFFKHLTGRCIHRSENGVIVKEDSGEYRGILWNADPDGTGNSVTIQLQLPAEGAEYTFLTRTVDETSCNPLKMWHDMGEPSHLSPSQHTRLKEHAVPSSESAILTAVDSVLGTKVTLSPNAVIYFEASKRMETPDRGYSYSRVVKG